MTRSVIAGEGARTRVEKVTTELKEKIAPLKEVGDGHWGRILYILAFVVISTPEVLLILVTDGWTGCRRASFEWLLSKIDAVSVALKLLNRGPPQQRRPLTEALEFNSFIITMTKQSGVTTSQSSKTINVPSV